ncbi:MAG: HNH endonuclease [Anaerolineae bacterium]|nr:HNH endonuclease [Anaerolineae bacterium]
MTLVDRITEALEALGGIAHYSELYSYLEQNAEAPLPRTWKASVRARIEENSSDSQAFREKNDLFFAVKGLGNGIWGLRSTLPEYIKAVDIDEPDNVTGIREGQNTPPTTTVETTRIIRDTLVTQQLKLLHHFQCQICGQSLHLYNQHYAEAHHIRPLGGGHHGSDTPNNIMVVCPNHHVEFDYGAIAVSPSELTIVHIDINYRLFGQPIHLHDLHQLTDENLNYHINNIFLGS